MHGQNIGKARGEIPRERSFMRRIDPDHPRRKRVIWVVQDIDEGPVTAEAVPRHLRVDDTSSLNRYVFPPCWLCMLTVVPGEQTVPDFVVRGYPPCRVTDPHVRGETDRHDG